MRELLFLVSVDDGPIGRLCTIYAINEQAAREKARPWLEAHPEFTNITIEACPYGFTLGMTSLPGSREQVEEQDSNPKTARQTSTL